MSTYRPRVDYSQSLQEAIETARLTAIDPNVTAENFPPPCRGIRVQSLQVQHQSSSVFERQLQAQLRRSRQRSANLYELLELIRQVDLSPALIVALGSRWFYPIGGNHCPFVYLGADFRELRLARMDRPFGTRCSFAVVLEETI